MNESQRKTLEALKLYEKLELQKNYKSDLLPCPFCGKNTVKVLPFENNKFILSHWYTNVSDCPIATADEDTGIGSTYFETEEEAIETWNKRG